MTGQIRKVFAENPGEFDPRKYLKPAMDAMTKLCKQRFEEFGTAGNASQDQAAAALGHGQALCRRQARPADRRVEAGGGVAACAARLALPWFLACQRSLHGPQTDRARPLQMSRSRCFGPPIPIGIASDLPRSPLADLVVNGSVRFSDPVQAQARCPTDTVVWVQFGSNHYRVSRTGTAAAGPARSCARPTPRARVIGPEHRVGQHEGSALILPGWRGWPT